MNYSREEFERYDFVDEDDGRFPHCDSLILHAPGVCPVCDHHPKAQQKRIDERVNFSLEDDPDKAPCPSTALRPFNKSHRWGGNTPEGYDGGFFTNKYQDR